MRDVDSTLARVRKCPARVVINLLLALALVCVLVYIPTTDLTPKTDILIDHPDFQHAFLQGVDHGHYTGHDAHTGKMYDILPTCLDSP
ncbi:hypothetical protein MJO29_016111 [Puccinia striiformis f. sp. tritici]|nr:hypothetical protein MJO29_016111 [Puccinia striiformis f. sp. tritici]